MLYNILGVRLGIFVCAVQEKKRRCGIKEYCKNKNKINLNLKFIYTKMFNFIAT